MHCLKVYNIGIIKLTTFLIGLMMVLLPVSIPADNTNLDPWADTYLSARLQPQVSILPSGTDLISLSMSPTVETSIEYRLPFLSILLARLDLAYTAIGREDALLNMIDVGPGIGMFFGIGRIGLSASFSGGLGIGIITDRNSGSTANTSNPYIAGGLNASYLFPANFSIGVGARYKSYAPFPLFHNLGVSLSVAYHFPNVSRTAGLIREVPPKIEILDAGFDQVFPVFYKYYDTNPVGTVSIQNGEDSIVRDVAVSLFVSQYMDGSKVSNKIDTLEPGEESIVDLYALFNPKILEVTEGTKATAEIKIEYWHGDDFKSKVTTETMQIFDRNAITWEDDRRAAAFVTRKDPVVLRLSKLVTGLVKNERPRIINENLANAMALFETLRVHGMSYEIDPSTPMADLHQKKTAVDFLQFPKQTLEYRAGDCDDLSILYTALLESIGIETAFITTPGHILVAFSTGVSDAEVDSVFTSSVGDFVFHEGKAWIPVEVTALDGGFINAWSLGSNAWRDGQRSRKAVFYPMHEAWEVYEPVGMPGDPSLRYPGETAIIDSFRKELSLYISREIRPQEDRLKQAIAENPTDLRLQNRLGVLYGKYGKMDDAETVFQNILQSGTYAPALLNMGNILRLRKENERALYYYDLAYDEMPENTSIITSIMTMSYELGDEERATEMYRFLIERAPETVEKYSQIAAVADGTTRSAEAIDYRNMVLWIED
jgi:hypothetical protein